MWQWIAEGGGAAESQPDAGAGNGWWTEKFAIFGKWLSAFTYSDFELAGLQCKPPAGATTMAAPCCQKQVIKLFKRDRKDKGDNDLRRTLKNEVVATNAAIQTRALDSISRTWCGGQRRACQVLQGEGSYGVVYGMQRCQCSKCTRSPKVKLKPVKYFENAMVTCHVGVSMQGCLDAFPNCAEFASVTDFQHVLFSVFVTCQAMVASNFRHNDLTARNVCVQLGVPETVRVGDHAFELRHKVRLIDCGLADTDYNPEYDPFSEK